MLLTGSAEIRFFFFFFSWGHGLDSLTPPSDRKKIRGRKGKEKQSLISTRENAEKERKKEEKRKRYN